MKQYEVCSNEDLRRLCIKEDWYNAGTNEQYEKLFQLNKQNAPIAEISLAIWLCTDGISRKEIHDKLLSTSKHHTA